MLYFKNERTKNTLCVETTVLKTIRVQSVLDVGFFQYKMQRNPVPHSHLTHELYFLEEGSCTTFCGDREYLLKKGDILLINAGTEHRWLSFAENTSLYSLKCSFCSIDEKDTLYEALSSALSLPRHLSEASELTDILCRARWELASRAPLYDEKAAALFRIFYIDLFRCLLDTPSGKANDRHFSIDPERVSDGQLVESTPQEFFMDVLDEFFTHFSPQNATLDELAARLYLSISQTQRLIKRYYGMSFKQKLVTAKVQKAARLIDESDAALEEIAKQVGYDSYNAFFEAFTSIMGRTPSQYRKERAIQ